MANIVKLALFAALAINIISDMISTSTAASVASVPGAAIMVATR